MPDPRWVDAPQFHREARIEDGAWSPYEDIIRQLYRDMDLTLKEVQAYMFDNYGFEATEHQYRTRLRRWRIFKKRMINNELSGVAQQSEVQAHSAQELRWPVSMDAVDTPRYVVSDSELAELALDKPGPADQYHNSPTTASQSRRDYDVDHCPVEGYKQTVVHEVGKADVVGTSSSHPMSSGPPLATSLSSSRTLEAMRSVGNNTYLHKQKNTSLAGSNQSFGASSATPPGLDALNEELWQSFHRDAHNLGEEAAGQEEMSNQWEHVFGYESELEIDMDREESARDSTLSSSP